MPGKIIQTTTTLFATTLAFTTVRPLVLQEIYFLNLWPPQGTIITETIFSIFTITKLNRILWLPVLIVIV
jgi:hypothetical protein